MPDSSIVDRLHGVFAPVTTPFDRVTGDIAPIPWRDNLRRWCEQPLDGLVLFGSTGEGALLDDDEKVRLTAFARDVVPAGIPLVVGASAESTRATIRQTRQLADAGADVVLTHPPAYFGPYLSPAAMRDYYVAVAEESPLPVLVYHMPKYTKVTLDAGLIGELTRHPNIVGLKDSSGDIKRFAEYTDACEKSCRLFVGNGTLLYTALELGAVGGILAVADFAPALAAQVVERFRAGDTQGAGRAQEQLTPLHKEIVASYGAVGVKSALDQLGWHGGPPRAPLAPLGAKDARKITSALKSAGLSAA
ncbi:MAG: dihydrodipicolinate synthase family protein [Longimicrobiales bacterium]